MIPIVNRMTVELRCRRQHLHRRVDGLLLSPYDYNLSLFGNPSQGEGVEILFEIYLEICLDT